MKTKLVVAGAAGLMGRRIVALAVDSGKIDIAGVVERQGHPIPLPDVKTETWGF